MFYLEDDDHEQGKFRRGTMTSTKHLKKLVILGSENCMKSSLWQSYWKISADAYYVTDWQFFNFGSSRQKTGSKINTNT